MIVFDLQCGPLGHRFEGWFGSTSDYEHQKSQGLVSCPMCGTGDVSKAVMAPNVGRKGNQMASPVAKPGPTDHLPVQPVANTPLPPEAVAMLKAVAAMQTEALKSSTWVGEKFAEDARAMHYGEKDAVPIHGRATLQQAQELAEEGIPVAPVIVPVIPPEEAN
jgi:hypothetical protein